MIILSYYIISRRCIDWNIRTKSRLSETDIIKEKIQHGSSGDENLILAHILQRHTSKLFAIIVYAGSVRDVEEKGHALPSDVFGHLVYEQLLF